MLQLGLAGCGTKAANTSSTTQTPTVLVSVFPLSPTIFINATVQLTATVTGSSNTSVTWSIQEGASGGSITPNGLFTAPAAPGTYHVIATSVADTAESASTSIVVHTIVINPQTAYVRIGQGFTFGVAPNVQVAWSVQEGSSGGSIAPSGDYTAPSTAGTYHIVAATIIGNATADATVSVNQQSGFSLFGNMAVARAAHTATLLPNHMVLMVDGGYFDIDDTLTPISSAEIFDPSTGKFFAAGATSTGREFHTATLLPNGKVLITGGGDKLNSAELYDPATNSFSQTGSMSISRIGHTATLLNDGTVLIVGGSSDSRAEIFNPATGRFSSTGSLATARNSHTATRLPDGRVLIVGGRADYLQPILSMNALSSSEIYDPRLGAFTSAGTMAFARTGHTATLLNNGTVLIAGGANSGVLASTEIYDPAAGQFLAGPSMNMPRTSHAAAILPNGEVVLAGGIPLVPQVYVGYAPTPTSEVYDPLKNSFTFTASMSDGRFWHTATALGDGRILIVGGGHSNAPQFGVDSVPTAEVLY